MFDSLWRLDPLIPKRCEVHSLYKTNCFCELFNQKKNLPESDAEKYN